MEPKILLVGRNLDVMEVLQTELNKADRDVICANSEESISVLLKNENIDIVVIGAGLPDEVRNSLQELITNTSPDINLHLIERTKDSSPYKMIDFANEKAVMWKIQQLLGRKKG